MTVASRPVGPFRIAPRLPGDKSITHRAYILGAMARGETVVNGPNRGQDCEATLRAVTELGAQVDDRETTVRLSGTAGRLRRPTRLLDLGNSGTGLRLLLGVLAGQPFSCVLTGDESLGRRPVERVLRPLRRMGARAEAPGDHPPVSLTGGPLRGIATRLSVPSAQVKSALLLAGVQAHGWTTVAGVGGSRDHTERMLRSMGVPVEEDPDSVAIQGPRAMAGTTVEVPGDPSAAAFYLAAAGVVPSSEVRLERVGLNPSRGDLFGVFADMGLEVAIEPFDPRAVEPMGEVRVRGARLRGLEVGPDRVIPLIDELPALAVAASFAHGTTTVRGARELRVKESDRLETMARGLASLGARIEPLPDGWRIHGSAGDRLPGGEVESRGDHRVAMSLLVAGLGCESGARILDPPGIETSDPYFINNLRQIQESL